MVPFTAACGNRTICRSGLISVCGNSNARLAKRAMGPSPCGIFGYSRIDAVGLEGHHSFAPLQAYDRLGQATRVELERPHAL